MNAPNYGGLGVNMKGKSSFGAFVAPPMNGGLFINLLFVTIPHDRILLI